MKKDNLEQFILTNKEAFDQIPNDAVWEKIAQRLPKQKVKTFNIRRFLGMAAAILLLIGVGIVIGLQLAPPNGQINSLATISPEYAEVEQFYASKVNYKLEQLAKLKANKDPLLEKDLNELDNWLFSLQKELKEVPKGNKEAIINAIINNYKTKLTILEEVLQDIQERKQEQLETIEEEKITI